MGLEREGSDVVTCRLDSVQSFSGMSAIHVSNVWVKGLHFSYLENMMYGLKRRCRMSSYMSSNDKVFLHTHDVIEI